MGERGLPLQIMFGVGGERDLSERELPHLHGWRGSAPVRVGNGAWTQRQQDVYGALLDAAYRLRLYLSDLEEPTRSVLVTAVETAAATWQEPDQGIWEVRGPATRYVQSALMCWIALDRGISLAPELDATDRTAPASSGLLPAEDSRIRGTIDAVAAGLSDERGLILRYRGGDGLCTFWLAEALAVTDRVEEAETLDDGQGADQGRHPQRGVERPGRGLHPAVRRGHARCGHPADHADR